MRLVPEECLPLPEAIAAIRAADIITIGPGSLYTSIIPNLLVSNVADAIADSDATKIFIANLMTQPGETDGYGFREHLTTVRDYAPQIHFDYAICNDRSISSEQARIYAADGAVQVRLQSAADAEACDAGIEVVRADLLEDGEMVRHSSERLARVVVDCAANYHAKKLAAADMTENLSANVIALN